MTTLQTDPSFKVSVIIPTYNTPSNKLKETVDSVLSQTEPDFELIIVDDGSTLPFAGIENDYKDSRIIFLRNEKNLGLAKTRNRGIENAKAPYIAFLDAGDYWLPQKLEKQLRLIASNKNTDMIFCGARFIAEGSYSYDLNPTRHDDWYKALLIGQPITGSASAVLVATDVCKNLGGFYTKEDLQQDREFWLRIAKKHNIDFVDEVLTVIEIIDDSLGSDPFKKEVTYRRFIDLHIRDMKTQGVYNKSLAYYHSRISHLYFRKRITIKGLKHMTISLFLWPRRSRLKLIFHYLYSLLTGENYLERVARNEFSENDISENDRSNI